MISSKRVLSWKMAATSASSWANSATRSARLISTLVRKSIDESSHKMPRVARSLVRFAFLSMVRCRRAEHGRIDLARLAALPGRTRYTAHRLVDVVVLPAQAVVPEHEHRALGGAPVHAPDDEFGQTPTGRPCWSQGFCRPCSVRSCGPCGFQSERHPRRPRCRTAPARRLGRWCRSSQPRRCPGCRASVISAMSE